VRRSAALLGIAATAAALGGGTAGASARDAQRSAPKTSHLLVYAQEWSLWPSRVSVPAGIVDVELWNRGQDIHDLRIRKLNSSGQMVGPVIGSVGHTMPGQVLKSTWRLRSPGHYELYCSLPGHLKLGMEARLTVKPDQG
jgi:plastocyanin